MADKNIQMKNYSGSVWDNLFPKVEGGNSQLTGYVKAGSVTNIVVGDTINGALGKLEKGLDGKQATLTNPELQANKGAANGYCPLGADSKVSSSYLPTSVAGGMVYKGVWDASTLAYPLTPSAGDYWICSVAGTVTADGQVYAVKDWAVYNGTSWDKLDNTDTIVSVNTLVGTVVLNGSHLLVTGYVKQAAAWSAIAGTDTINEALGKLEKGLDAKQATGSYATAASVTGATKTKITYNAQGIITAGADSDARDFLCTGYSIAGSVAAIATTDSISVALGKLEKGIAAKADKVTITGATKTKITYNVDGIITSGADATAADFVCTGYSKAGAEAAVAAGDSINVALGKLEKGLDRYNKVTVNASQPSTPVTNDFWYQVL